MHVVQQKHTQQIAILSPMAFCKHTNQHSTASILVFLYGTKVLSISSVQPSLLAPGCSMLIRCTDYRPDVKNYEPVFNLCGQNDMELAKQLTGRDYKPTKYWLDTLPDSGTRKITVRACSFMLSLICV